MNIWIWSDPHFAKPAHHAKLIEWESRPSNYEELIVERHNHVVQPTDLSICLGDVVIGGNELWEQYFDKMNGVHILCRGNHDSKSYSSYMGRGFKFACETFTWRYGGFDIIFSHWPLNESILINYDINIHGHCHSKCKDETLTDKHILYAPELSGYAPVKLDTLLKGRAQPERSQPNG